MSRWIFCIVTETCDKEISMCIFCVISPSLTWFFHHSPANRAVSSLQTNYNHMGNWIEIFFSCWKLSCSSYSPKFGELDMNALLSSAHVCVEGTDSHVTYALSNSLHLCGYNVAKIRIFWLFHVPCLKYAKGMKEMLSLMDAIYFLSGPQQCKCLFSFTFWCTGKLVMPLDTCKHGPNRLKRWNYLWPGAA